MAEQFDLVTPDIVSPDTENPYGTYEDEDTGVAGTPILANWKNSMKAFFERLILRTGKTYSGIADESNGVAQFYDALDEVTTGDDSLLNDWASGTFNQNDVVRYGGKQWFCGVASTINTPGPNSEWAKSKTFDKYMEMATEGEIVKGALIPLNDIRDLTNYATYYKAGKFDWNGGKWEAWRINIDGSAHVSGTSDVAKLLALYKYEDNVVESDTAGTLTLKNYQGRVSRAVDASGGLTQDIGDIQGDQFQGHRHAFQGGSGAYFASTSAFGGSTSTDVSGLLIFDPITDGTNGEPRTGENTRDTSVAEGLWGIICIVPEGTI